MKLKKLLNYFKPKPWEKNAVIILLFIALIGIAINSIYTAEITTNAIKETRENYTSISETAGKYTEEGNRLFELAHIEYELGNFTAVIDSCKEARKKYSKAEFQYAKAIVTLKPFDERYQKLIDLNYLMINITNAKYEACEYLEYSALNSLHGDYYRTALAINRRNEKIELHDKYIGEYRLLLAELERDGTLIPEQ